MSNNRRNFSRGRRHHHKNGDKRGFGLFIIVIGTYLLFRKLDIIPHINWHDYWPMILIVIGVILGIKNKFRNNAPYILIAVGAFYLIPPFMIAGVSSTKLVLPALLILIGLYIVLKPKNKGGTNRKECFDDFEVITNDSSKLNIDVTFGGRKAIVTSKEFTEGNVAITFGGAEINLLQADSSIQPMVLNIKVAFGGVEILVPSHWEVQNNITPTLGSVEDHRSIQTTPPDNTEDRKILILNGSCNFGSVELKSY